jgi:hypothetical protein
MNPTTRTPAPEALAAGLKARLRLVFSGLGWRHDDIALEMYRDAEHLARYAATSMGPRSPARSPARSQARSPARSPARSAGSSRASALAAARQLDGHLTFLHRTGAVHGAAVPAASRALARLVGAIAGPARPYD